MKRQCDRWFISVFDGKQRFHCPDSVKYKLKLRVRSARPQDFYYCEKCIKQQAKLFERWGYEYERFILE